MASHSSVLAWRIPGTGSLVGCLHGVAQSQTRLNDLAAAVAEIFLDVRTGLEEVNNDIQWVGTRQGWC